MENHQAVEALGEEAEVDEDMEVDIPTTEIIFCQDNNNNHNNNNMKVISITTQINLHLLQVRMRQRG